MCHPPSERPSRHRMEPIKYTSILKGASHRKVAPDQNVFIQASNVFISSHMFLDTHFAKLHKPKVDFRRFNEDNCLLAAFLNYSHRRQKHQQRGVTNWLWYFELPSALRRNTGIQVMAWPLLAIVSFSYWVIPSFNQSPNPFIFKLNNWKVPKAKKATNGRLDCIRRYAKPSV